MARIASQEGHRPSILDRLIDPESEGTSWRRGYSVDQVIDAVRKDLEDLLNSHQTDPHIPEELAEVRRSIVAYGLPDLASQSSTGPDAARRVCAALEEVIGRFEPRLANVRAVPVKSDAAAILRLNFEIQATLRLDPAPEVTFVTLLKLTTGEATIQRAGE
jgi:type VI secretion system protein ImpF